MKKIRKDIEISELIYKSLRGETTGDEEKLLSAWCLEPRNRELFMELRDANNLYDGVAYMYNVDTEEPFKKIKEKIQNKKHKYLISYLSGIVAAMLVGVVLIFMLMDKEKTDYISYIPEGQNEPRAVLVTTSGNIVYPEDSIKQLSLNTCAGMYNIPIEENMAELKSDQIMDIEYNVLSTSKKGNIKVTLYDGSQVWLNADSELKYPNTFVDDKRVVYLKGEAFFEVAKDPAHPFIINTFSAEINVLGTSFNVNAYDASCITTLVEGKVRMKNLIRDSVEIHPGEQAFITKYGSIGVREVDTRYFTGWMKNLFAFKDAPLHEIMDELCNWYGFTYRFENPKIGNILYTTMVKKFPEVDRVLEILEGTGDFRFIKVNDLIIIKEK